MKPILLLVPIILISGIAATFFLSHQKVPMQQKRIEQMTSGNITVSLILPVRTVTYGKNMRVSVDLKNTTPNSFQLNTAGVDLQFDPNVFTVSNVSCNSGFLPNVAKGEVANNKILLTCMSAGGSMKTLSANSAISLGYFDLQAKTSAPKGTSPISLSRTLVPNAGDESYKDLSVSGGSLDLTISGN